MHIKWQHTHLQDLHLICSATQIHSRAPVFLLFIHMILLLRMFLGKSIEQIWWSMVIQVLEHLGSPCEHLLLMRLQHRNEPEKGCGWHSGCYWSPGWQRHSGCLCNVCLWQIRATGVLKLQQQRESICFTNFITLIENVHKLLPKHWWLPSTAIISGGSKLLININYQGHIFVKQQK